MTRFINSGGDALAKSIFFIALFGGGGAIAALRIFTSQAWLPIIPAVFAIVIYAFFAYYSKENRASLDQAGDNAYYLGLLFTLISLIFALWQVQILLPEKNPIERSVTILQLLPDFGLALISTIVGIVARVVLQQFRGSIEEFEERARIELSVATATLRDTLQAAVGDFANAARAATAALDNITEHTQTTLKSASAATAKAVRGVGKQIDRASTEFAASTATATQRMQEFSEQSGEAERKLKAQSEALVDDWREQHTVALKELGQQSTKSINQLTTHGGELLSQILAHIQTQNESAAERLREQTALVDVGSIRAGENLAALGNHAATAQEKIANLTDASEKFTHTLSELTHAIQDATKRAAKQSTKAEQTTIPPQPKPKQWWKFWRRR